MEKGWLRTIMVLACGAAMALVAYAGQAGPTNDSFQLGGFEGETIHVREIDGLRLDYRLVGSRFPKEAGKSPEPSELVLYIASEDLEEDLEAMVTFRVLGPRGSQLKALALPIEGRYEADIFLESSGTYQITTEIQTPRGMIKDVFKYAVS